MARIRTNRRADEQTVPGGTVREVIEQAKQQAPTNIFLVAPESGRVLNYEDLDQNARRVSQYLYSLGLRKGDVV